MAELLAAQFADFLVRDFFGGIVDGHVVDGQPVCEEVVEISLILPHIVIALRLMVSGQDRLGVV